jgi:lipoate---protein ligase
MTDVARFPSHISRTTFHAFRPPLRLLDLGFVSPLRSQTVYHAVAYAMTDESPDTIILVSPSAPYVCAGYHQELEKEIDLDYCRARGLPVYRREVGGGAVYLDGDQLFVQWVIHRDLLPSDLESQFDLYIRPLVATYRALGVPAVHRPVNDIQVAGRKIGGTGAASIGAAGVLVGSLMFDFDRQTMARVLKVSSEKMRDKIVESLETYMTTLQEQLGRPADREAVKAIYLRECAVSLGAEIVPGEWTAAEEAAAAELDLRFDSPDWLHAGAGLRRLGVKISEGVQVVEGLRKAPGGLIRATVRLADGRVDDVVFSGDFALLPAAALDGLAECLLGAKPRREALLPRLIGVYEALAIQSPGVSPQDFTEAVLDAAGSDLSLRCRSPGAHPHRINL